MKITDDFRNKWKPSLKTLKIIYKNTLLHNNMHKKKKYTRNHKTKSYYVKDGNLTQLE